MKTFLKIALVCVPLLMAAPSFAQVSWGVNLSFGSPAPREVIVERPYADAVWYPGFYNHVGYRNFWVPGRWERPARFREGWGADRRDEGNRFERRGMEGNRDQRFSDRGRGQGDQRHAEGRIR